ncbi:NADH-ubiquinone oxidoreductase-F iron-sulfur binding region domain-containing protein [Chloroflexota bacterium]
MNFEQIYLKAGSECSFLSDKDCTKIYISSSEDNAAWPGVSGTFSAEIDRHGTAAEVITTGSSGYYGLEPIVRIEKPGHPSILYNNVTSEAASALVNDYLINDNPMPDMALCSIGGDRIDGIPDISELPLFKLQDRIALRNCGYIDPENINHYILHGQGYSGLAKALQTGPTEVIAELKKSGLRGRGGAGYFTADKWQICHEVEGDEKYIICNAVDADPHSLTARLILESDPHSALEGILIAAYAVGASRCFVCVNARYEQAIKMLTRALEQMREYSLIGGNILDSDFSVEIEIREEADLFVSGEETALLRSIEGKQALPYIRTVYPAVSGLYNKPTLINNLETMSGVSAIFQNGPEWYSGFGTEQSKGTKVITLAGSVVHRYTIEVPFGTTLRSIIAYIGGGVPDGKNIKAVQFGGPTGVFFTADSPDISVDFESMEKAGSIIGSGVVEVFDSACCAVEMTRDIIQYIQTQSCGKCVFCREGSYQTYDILKDISENGGKPHDMDLLFELGEAMMTGCICGLGSTAPNPVLSSIRLFSDDYDAHIKDKRCPVNDKG